MMKNNTDWLPPDMLDEILLKLPVKSIIRFKCTVKTWCYLFQSPSFISQHLSISKRKKQLLVYYCEGTLENPVVIMRLFVDRTLVSYQNMRQQLPYNFANMFVFIFCIDNGLLCLCDRANSRITLCNPAARDCRILPEFDENLPKRSYTYSHTLGFGLDPWSNDYKVIYIRTYMDKEKDMQGPDHYTLYKMSTDSWRVLRLEDSQLSEDIRVCPNENNACVNGVYYWQADDMILAFYLGTEVFQLIQSPYPKSFGRLLPLNNQISFWDTELMFRSYKTNEVWVLNDEGHWTKVLKIEHILEVGRIFGFWRNYKLLVESVIGQLLLYNLETKEFNDVGIKCRDCNDLLQVYTCEECLVATKRD